MPEVDHLRILLDTAQKMQSTTDTGSVMRELLDSAMIICGASAGSWAVFRDGKMYFKEYRRGGETEALEYTFEPGRGVPGWVIEHKQFYITNDAAKDPIVVPELQKKYGFYNLLDIPFFSRSGELLGCFELYNKEGGFVAHDVDKLRGLVYLAVLAFENAILFQKQAESQLAIQRRLDFEKLIAAISTSMINVDFNQIDSAINEALGIIAEFFCVDRAYVFLYTENHGTMSNTHEWVRRGIRPFRDELQGIATNVFPWIDAQLKAGKSVLVEDVGQLGEDAANEKQEWLREDIQSIACVPMIARDKVIGFVGLDSVLIRTDMTEEYVRLLRTAGEIFANTIDRKRSEQAILSSEKKYKELVESMSEGLAVNDADYNFTYVNPSFGAMLGISVDKIIGRNFIDFLDEDEKKVLAEQIEKRKRGETGRYELTWTSSTGAKIVTMVAPRPLFDENGVFAGSFAVLNDITDLKRAEDTIKQNEKMLRLILDTIPVSVFWKDVNSVFLGCNRVVVEDAGLSSPEDLIGKTDFDFVWSARAPDYIKDDKEVIQSGEAKLNILERLTSSDGSTKWIKTYKVPLRDLEGRVIGVLGTWQDITEVKVQSQQLEMLNRELAGKNKELEAIIYVASHDLKTPLVNIQGFGHELLSGCQQVANAIKERGLFGQLDDNSRLMLTERIPESLEYIRAGVDKMDGLLRGLLEVSRLSRPAGQVQVVDVNSVINSVIESLKRQIEQKRVMVEVEVLPACMAGRDDVGQIFWNLLSNAISYLTPARPGVIRVSGKIEEGMSVYCVEDNGIGIPAANVEKIFEIFYRLEPDKTVGQGIGLTMVRRILDRYDGWIRVESEVGKGSRFYVGLPAVREAK